MATVNELIGQIINPPKRGRQATVARVPEKPAASVEELIGKMISGARPARAGGAETLAATTAPPKPAIRSR